MKKLKLLFITMLVIFAVISMAACSAGSKTNDTTKKTDQNQTSTNSNNTGNNTGGSISVGEKLKWPKELLGSLPEPKAKITGIIKDESKGQCTVALAEMTKEDAKNYAAKIKEKGYKAELEAEDGDSIFIVGTANYGSQVCFTYNITAKDGTIFYTDKGTNSTNISTNTTPDMTDAMPWPKDFIKGVPELTGRIADVNNNNNTDVIVNLEYVKKVDFENYIKQLKSNGYTVESGEDSNVDKIEFGGNNADGDSVYTCFFIAQDGNVGVATVYMKKASK